MVIDIRKKEATIPSSMIRGDFVEWIPSYKYLGAELQNHLNTMKCYFWETVAFGSFYLENQIIKV